MKPLKDCINYCNGLALWLDELLEKIKDTKGETISDFADEIGINERQLRGMARHGFTMTIENLCKICSGLDIKPSQLLWDIEQTIKNKLDPIKYQKKHA